MKKALAIIALSFVLVSCAYPYQGYKQIIMDYETDICPGVMMDYVVEVSELVVKETVEDPQKLASIAMELSDDRIFSEYAIHIVTAKVSIQDKESEYRRDELYDFYISGDGTACYGKGNAK